MQYIFKGWIFWIVFQNITSTFILTTLLEKPYLTASHHLLPDLLIASHATKGVVHTRYQIYSSYTTPKLILWVQPACYLFWGVYYVNLTAVLGMSLNYVLENRAERLWYSVHLISFLSPAKCLKHWILTSFVICYLLLVHIDIQKKLLDIFWLKLFKSKLDIKISAL